MIAQGLDLAMILSQVFFNRAVLAFMTIFFLTSLLSFVYLLHQCGTLLAFRHGPGLLLKPSATLPSKLVWSSSALTSWRNVTLSPSSLPPREFFSLALFPYTSPASLPPRWAVPSPLAAFEKNDNVFKIAVVALSEYFVAPLANLVLGCAWLLMHMCYQLACFLLHGAWIVMYLCLQLVNVLALSVLVLMHACLQLVNIILIGAWVLMHMAYPICFHVANFAAVCMWLLLGMLCWATKSFCFVCVADRWFRVWTGDDSQDGKTSKNGVNLEVLNLCLWCHTAFQTLPNLLLYIINGSLLQHWSPVAIAGLFFTVGARPIMSTLCCVV